MKNKLFLNKNYFVNDGYTKYLLIKSGRIYKYINKKHRNYFCKS